MVAEEPIVDPSISLQKIRRHCHRLNHIPNQWLCRIPRSSRPLASVVWQNSPEVATRRSDSETNPPMALANRGDSQRIARCRGGKIGIDRLPETWLG
jgi:hypothetical protein